MHTRTHARPHYHQDDSCRVWRCLNFEDRSWKPLQGEALLGKFTPTQPLFWEREREKDIFLNFGIVRFDLRCDLGAPSEMSEKRDPTPMSWGSWHRCGSAIFGAKNRLAHGAPVDDVMQWTVRRVDSDRKSWFWERFFRDCPSCIYAFLTKLSTNSLTICLGLNILQNFVK